ncbi:MAG: LemA family protein [Burkholderiales bacterium]
MDTSQFVWGAVGAMLLFWIVGAYNRLVRLRGSIVRRFPPIDEQFTLRHGLLQQQIDALTPVLPSAAARIEVLRAACRQVEAACAHARQRPGAVGAVTSLRLADDILAEARARLPVQSVAGVDLSELNARITASDATLAFARRQFNEAVMVYNAAVRQFPTLLIVGLFGFRSAGTL